ncbi:MAG: phospho-sugar mutase [Candidatus Nanopelagicales bacterium]
MSLNQETLKRIEEWIQDDPDPITQSQTKELLASASGGDQQAIDTLQICFGPILQFGTAGLRGPLGPGPSCMNRAVVGRAAAGLCNYLKAKNLRKLIVGYDARHNSYRFALDTVEIAAGLGIESLLLPNALPTPVLSFAIRYYSADAGVMVTASHNPAADNGYKVYLGDGSQIISPVDSEIAAQIDAVTSVAALKRGDTYQVLDETAVEAYIERTSSLVHPQISRTIRVASTSLHGVGDEVWQKVFYKAGFTSLHVVESQQSPDPDFPTVRFPNPEEQGATDLLIELARQQDADVAIAHDPDADRCACAIKDNGIWRLLRGDELGSLLAWWLIERAQVLNLDAPRGTFASSIVSSTLLEAIAHKHNLNYQSTLTGFKWISKIPDLAFGYEEALGYCVDPKVVRDKDGISAAIVVVELAAYLKSKDLSISDVLQQIADEYGVYITDQLSVRFANLALIPEAIKRLRENPPTKVAGLDVQEIVDLQNGWKHLPPTNGMMLLLDGGRVIARPSGTEPKLKCYLEVTIKSSDIEKAQNKASQLLKDMKSDMAIALGVSS